MRKPKDSMEAEAAAGMTKDLKATEGNQGSGKRRGRPAKSERPIKMELPGERTDQERMNELEQMASRASGGLSNTGAIGGTGGERSMAEAELARNVKAEREKLGVGEGTADPGLARTTGEVETDDGTAHRRGLSKVKTERQPRKGTKEAPLVASGQDKTTAASDLGEPPRRGPGRPRGSAVRGRHIERAGRGKAGGGAKASGSGSGSEKGGNDGGDTMATTHRRGRPAGSKNEPAGGRRMNENTGRTGGGAGGGERRNEGEGTRGEGTRGEGTRAPRSRAAIRGTRGGAGAATLERPATGQRQGETSQAGAGGFTMELRKRRKSPRMGKVVLKPTPIFDCDEIRDIRLRLRMSQMSFADLLGVSVKAVEAWEAGRNRPGGPALRLMDLYVTNPELIPFG